MAVVMSSDGICATSPSPMESRVYVRSATSNGSPRITIPMMKPPMILMMMMDDADLYVALYELRGSIHGPVKVGLLSDLAAALAGLSSVITPLDRSESMLICFPASRVEGEPWRRLPRSRVAPLVIT